jgi:hypothetical protein
MLKNQLSRFNYPSRNSSFTEILFIYSGIIYPIYKTINKALFLHLFNLRFLLFSVRLLAASGRIDALLFFKNSLAFSQASRGGEDFAGFIVYA